MGKAAPSGLEARTRELLDRLHRATDGPFDVDEAQAIFGLPRQRTTRLLAHLASGGWLSRIQRGLYTTVPLGASKPGDWREDPWLVAARAFDPCYLGGWTAFEHWGLTEQVFRDIVVVTARKVRARDRRIQEVVYRLRHRAQELHFGTTRVWRDGGAVAVSDQERTLVDTLDDPGLGGGIRHVADCLATYFDSGADEQRLLDYAERLGNRTAYKRLGYLLEALSIDAPGAIAACLERQSSGISALDPTVDRRGRILKRWNLRLNVDLRG